MDKLDTINRYSYSNNKLQLVQVKMDLRVQFCAFSVSSVHKRLPSFYADDAKLSTSGLSLSGIT